MAVTADVALRTRAFTLTRGIELPCVALSIGYLVFLAACYVKGYWLVEPNGSVMANDFVNVWAAGHQALQGNAAAAYDPKIHKAIEDAVVGHHFEGEYPWNYPPFFLFVAGGLALLPILAANAVWLLLTFPLYLATMLGIIRERAGLLFACAFPGILANATAVQNGFLTAALIGGGLLWLERRPLLAGLLIGCLTFKPHLGLLFPLVLIVGGHWRAVATATGTALVLIGASYLVFGAETWVAFVHALPATSQAALAEGRADFAKLQSVYGLVRMLGGSESLGWLLHGAFAAGVAVGIAALWRTRAAFELKAAGLATGALLTTPYLFMYDIAVLGVPMAFLVRASLDSGDTGKEMARLAPACALILSFFAIKAPVGFAAALVVALLVARRGWPLLFRSQLTAGPDLRP